MRFNRAELGAWYAAKAVETAIAEVAHHLRREAIARGEISMSRKYRSYSAELLGSDFHDICGLQSSQPDIYRSDSYVARSEEHTSELQSLMRISYAVICLNKKQNLLNIL